MRKRAQRRSKPIIDESKHVSMKVITTKEEKSSRFGVKKNWWIAVSLLGIFLLILFFNSYYNATTEISINPEGEGFDKFYLSGPDPYYNMRLVEKTHETGRYPYYSEEDPLLDYPLGRSGARAPLFNMMALGFSRVLTPFMDEIDAIGYSMQFIPALFGALLIFPVYFIGKELFNRKAGLIGALFVALIPIHLGSGHGSAFSLFDHDSFNLLLFFMTFLFLIKSLKEKDPTKSLLYAILGGVPLAALSMTWVKSQYLYVIIAIYAFVQMFIDIFKNKIDFSVFKTTSVVLFTGYLISLPVLMAGWGGFSPDINLFLCLGVTIFGLIYYIFGKTKIPWTLSIPAVFCVGITGLVVLHPSVLQMLSVHITFLGPLGGISEIVYGSGIYGGKVSMTIAEANTYQISHSVMSFGPAMYWLGWTGFLFLIFYFYKNKNPPGRDYLFIIVLFLVSIWLTTIAGRFINDMVPVIAMLAGWIVWMLLEWIDYRQMIRNIRSAGGGFHGIRRGVKFIHVFGILFVAFLVLLPNAFIAFDAAIPVNAPTQDGESDLKTDMFGEEHAGAFGLGIGKERYWADAFKWLSEQDQDIKNPADRPAFISWWDYGFYEVAMGEHPTVADNFQDGIPPAGNFHTATSEKEAVAVLIVRLLEGDVKNNDNKISNGVKSVLIGYLKDGNNTDNASKIISWIEDPTSSPSYKQPIDPQYHKYISEEINTLHLTVGAEWRENAAYHDIVNFLINETHGFSDEEITWLYHDIQEATGWSIRYYGVEGYDKQIFNIFAFLSDKSLLMVGAPQDDFVMVKYIGYWVDDPSDPDSPKTPMEWPAQEIYDMPDDRKRHVVVEDQSQSFQDLYFDTMFYKTYFGPKDPEKFKVQIPCTGMKHFYAEYMSDLSKPFSQYYSGIGAVVIAKYYEGAVINGTLLFNNSGTMEPLDAQVVITKDVAYTSETSYFIDHDEMNTTNGNFDLIAGAGAVLQIRRYPELDSGIPWFGGKSFVMKEITLNVSDDDAMRKTDNWQRNLGNITIDPANISGYVFDNMDNNGTYNVSVDKPLSNVTVILQGISKMELTYDEVGNAQLVPVEKDLTMIKTNTTNEMGYYSVSGLKPGYYIIETRMDGIPIDRSLIPLSAGDISVNISKPKSASVEGIVYYDQNQNNEYDSGEEEGDANVSIYHREQDPVTGEYQEMLVDSTTTSSNGSYKFESLIPGKIKGININEYVIKVSKLPMYQSEVIISPDENKTTMFNISVALAPVNVSGLTKNSKGQAVGGVIIEFEKDESVGEDNTAVTKIAEPSNETTGYYQIDLTPGKYNVTAELVKGDTIIYSYTGKLNVSKGQGSKSYDINLVRESVNISGQTKERASGEDIGGVTINYEPDGSVINNTAKIPDTPISDENGYYTVELTPGSYNITASKHDDMGTLVYYSESQLSVDADDDGRTVDISVDKKSVTVSGTASYNNVNNENITVYFEKDGSVENNNAEFAATSTDNTGFTLELIPGSYNVTVIGDLFVVDGVNYTYNISEDTTNKLTVNETDIATGVTFNIKLEMNEKEFEL